MTAAEKILLEIEDFAREARKARGCCGMIHQFRREESLETRVEVVRRLRERYRVRDPASTNLIQIHISWGEPA